MAQSENIFNLSKKMFLIFLQTYSYEFQAVYYFSLQCLLDKNVLTVFSIVRTVSRVNLTFQISEIRKVFYDRLFSLCFVLDAFLPIVEPSRTSSDF